MLRLVLGYLRTLWDAGAPLLRPVAHASWPSLRPACWPTRPSWGSRR